MNKDKMHIDLSNENVAVPEIRVDDLDVDSENVDDMCQEDEYAGAMPEPDYLKMFGKKENK